MSELSAEFSKPLRFEASRERIIFGETNNPLDEEELEEEELLDDEELDEELEEDEELLELEEPDDDELLEDELEVDETGARIQFAILDAPVACT